MPKILKQSFNELYEIADSQSGYFTAKQALAAGYSDRMQTYHVQTGDWIREWRGIYRLHHYPNPRPDDLMLWYLWSADREGKPRGVYSHETALELHELSSWTGARLDMTVPKYFRRSVVPSQLRFHHADVDSKDVVWMRQLPVTTPIRTILDLVRGGRLQRHHVIEAMHDARRRGLIVQSDLTRKTLSDADLEILLNLDAESQNYSPEA